MKAKTMTTAPEKLNSVSAGWTGLEGGVHCNPNAGGGFIDKAIVSQKWFVIFNDHDAIIENIGSFAEAVDVYVKVMK